MARARTSSSISKLMSDTRTNFIMLFLYYTRIGTANVLAVTLSWLTDRGALLGRLLRVFDIRMLLRILSINHHPDMLVLWFFLRCIYILVRDRGASNLACLVVSWKLIGHRCNCSWLRYLWDLCFFSFLFILDYFSIKGLCEYIILNLLLWWNWLCVNIILLGSHLRSLII